MSGLGFCYLCLHHSHPPAVRSTTLGTWRMLTLGAEYEDTWAPSPDRRRLPGQQAEEEPGQEGEDTDALGGEPGEASWGAVDTRAAHKYDTVLHLHGVSRAERKDGVRQMVRKHGILNSMPWPAG